jgi:hypothetical protein
MPVGAESWGSSPYRIYSYRVATLPGGCCDDAGERRLRSRIAPPDSGRAVFVRWRIRKMRSSDESHAPACQGCGLLGYPYGMQDSEPRPSPLARDLRWVGILYYSLLLWSEGIYSRGERLKAQGPQPFALRPVPCAVWLCHLTRPISELT